MTKEKINYETYTLVNPTSNGAALLVNGGQGLINIVMNSGNQKQLESHVNLIKAAPDLLKACELALSNLRPVYPQSHLVIELLTKAIDQTKVKG